MWSWIVWRWTYRRRTEERLIGLQGRLALLRDEMHDLAVPPADVRARTAGNGAVLCDCGHLAVSHIHLDDVSLCAACYEADRRRHDKAFRIVGA